ncbi:hypothetical protein AKJ16_DCAP05791 [Drosera capensis]
MTAAAGRRERVAWSAANLDSIWAVAAEPRSSSSVPPWRRLSAASRKVAALDGGGSETDFGGGWTALIPYKNSAGAAIMATAVAAAAFNKQSPATISHSFSKLNDGIAALRLPLTLTCLRIGPLLGLKIEPLPSLTPNKKGPMCFVNHDQDCSGLKNLMWPSCISHRQKET